MSTLDWLLNIRADDCRTRLETYLPWAYWDERPHPITEEGRVETLCSPVSGPWDEAEKELTITFDGEGRPWTAQLVTCFESRRALREASDHLAGELDQALMPFRAPLFVALPEGDMAVIDERWWLTDSACSMQVLAAEAADARAAYQIVARVFFDRPLLPFERRLRALPIGEMRLADLAAAVHCGLAEDCPAPLSRPQRRKAPELEGPGVPLVSV